MLAGIKRTPLQSEIIKFIQSFITQEGLKAGDRLPSQEKLIHMMGVSRTSLREAIKTLEAKNILEVRNGKGVYVKDFGEQEILHQLEFVQEKEMLLELLQVRRILEREIVSLVVKNATEAELDKVEDILKVIMEKYNNGERQNEEDRAFHNMLAQFAHNRILQQIVESIGNKMDQFRNFPLEMESPFTETMPVHLDLYKAIRARDVKKAQEINDQILNMIEHDVKTHY